MSGFFKNKVTATIRFAVMVALFVVMPSPAQSQSQSFEQIAVGASHICALDGEGRVECTTTSTAQRFLPPEDLPPMSKIVAGQQHSCGITLDGNVLCWGEDVFGVLQPPTFDAPVASIASGFNHVCAIDINNVTQCWGLGSNDQLDVPDVPGGFVKVAAARTASCGIDTAGDVHCWTTDSFFNPDGPIAGPFVDIAIDSNQACGITGNGDIECWAARERQNLFPPTNGPYIDLTVTNSAICGLRGDQLLDCSFAAPTLFELDTRAEEYPLDVRFSSIERSNFQFGGVPICGIRADNGSISCFGSNPSDNFSGSLPAPPGSSPMAAAITASNFILGLTAEVYSRNQVELFWNRVPNVFPPISVEVYRDDELLTTTRNSLSFYDNDDSVTSEESRYRIRTVDDAGNVGEFSNLIVVNRATAEVSLADSEGGGIPGADDLLRIRDVSVTAFAQFVANNDSFILTWSLDNPSSVPVAGFEIRINNEPSAFVTSSTTTFVGDGVDLNFCRIYSVAAVADDGTILDYGSAAFGNSAIVCPR